MEISSSALTGALRVGVQVVVGRKRPVLEIYQQLHNDFDPPFEIDLKDSAGRPPVLINIASKTSISISP